MPSYKHTESIPNLVWFYSIAVSAILLLMIITGVNRESEALYVLLPIFIFGFAVMMLSSMTTMVKNGIFHLWFGPGLFHIKIPCSELLVLGRVEVDSLTGIGIRLTPNGWLYRIRNNEVILIQRIDGPRVMIGTDDPDGLEQALRQV